MSSVLDMENQIIQKELISHDPNLPGILSLEYSLLDIGSNPCLTQGVLYIMPITFGNKVFVKKQFIYPFDTCTIKVKLKNYPLHTNI